MAGLQEERRARERFERNRQRWVELERARATARDRVARAVDLLADLTARVGRADSELAQIEARLRDLAPRAEAAKARLEEHSALETRRADLDRELQILATDVEEDRVAERSLERLEEDLQSDEVERSEHARALLALRSSLEGVQARLSAATALEAEMSRARDQVLRVREEETRAARESARAEALAETLRRQLREARERLEERSKLLAEGRGRRELATWFSQTFREGVLTLERRLLGRAQAEFERALARYFSLLVEDAGLVARCDPAFSPSVEIDGEWTPPEALSGGERTALALAFRLALGGVVRSAGRLTLETLILDEPTDGFSPEQVVRMGELLEHLGIPQVLLVSHEPQLTSVAERTVRVEKRDGRSTLSAEPEIGPPAAPALSPWESKPRRKARSTRLDPPAVPPP
jgi:exonuclease SbcC